MNRLYILLVSLFALGGCNDSASTPVRHVPVPVIPPGATATAGFSTAEIEWVKIATLPLIFLTSVAGAVLFYAGLRKTGLFVAGLGPIVSSILVFYAEYLGLCIHLILWSAILAAVGGLIYAIYLHRKGINLTVAAQKAEAVIKADLPGTVSTELSSLGAKAKAILAKIGL